MSTGERLVSDFTERTRQHGEARDVDLFISRAADAATFIMTASMLIQRVLFHGRRPLPARFVDVAEGVVGFRAGGSGRRRAVTPRVNFLQVKPGEAREKNKIKEE